MGLDYGMLLKYTKSIKTVAFKAASHFRELTEGVSLPNQP